VDYDRRMKCRICGSEKIYRSQRHGLKEGLLLRIIWMAPFRCRDCGSRYVAFNKRQGKIRKDHNQSWADFLGLRGREYKLRQWAIAFIITLFLLGISIIFLLRILQ
jgi:hypothetical protein